MTTWVGHTTRESRKQRHYACPCCGHMTYLSTETRVVSWLQENPGQWVRTAVIASRFGVLRITAYHAMRKAFKAGKVIRKKAEYSANEWEWTINPLVAATRAVPSGVNDGCIPPDGAGVISGADTAASSAKA